MTDAYSTLTIDVKLAHKLKALLTEFCRQLTIVFHGARTTLKNKDTP